jgi:hypothetical protein
MRLPRQVVNTGHSRPRLGLTSARRLSLCLGRGSPRAYTCTNSTKPPPFCRVSTFARTPPRRVAVLNFPRVGARAFVVLAKLRPYLWPFRKPRSRLAKLPVRRRFLCTCAIINLAVGGFSLACARHRLSVVPVPSTVVCAAHAHLPCILVVCLLVWPSSCSCVRDAQAITIISQPWS